VKPCRIRLYAVVVIVLLTFCVLTLPLVAEAQPPGRPYRIGVLHEAFVPNIPQVQGLKAGLKSMGLEEGRDVTFEILFTRGVLEATSAAAADLVKAKVDLIFAANEEATQAAKAATNAIPVVFVRVGDPVAAGIVTAIARPGGNVTGISSLDTELAPKRLEILKTIVPRLRRVWAVYHASDRSAGAAAQKAKEAAPLLKLEVLTRAVRTSEELVASLKAVQPGDGLISPPSVNMNIPGLILDLEREARVPAVFFSAFWVRGGAMVSYGSDFYAAGVQAARLVARVLRGTKPYDLPVEGADKIELAVNLKAARNLGITIPREILLRADHVIE